MVARKVECYEGGLQKILNY